MKKLMVLTIGLFVAASVTAQPHGKGKPKMNAEERATKLTDWMTENLSLTSEQQPKILELHKRHFAQMDSIRKNAAGDKEAMKQAAKGVKKELHDGYKIILTEAQWKKLKELREEKKQEASDPQKRAEMMTEHMKVKLSLREDQIPKVLEVNKSFTTKMAEIRAQKTAGTITDEKAAELRKEAVKARKEALEKVLDDEQKKIIAEEHKQHKGKNGKGGKHKNAPTPIDEDVIDEIITD